MTIAERAALVEKQKMEQYLKQQDQARMQAAAWNGLDSLAISGRNSTLGMGNHANHSKDDGWALGVSASVGNSSSTSANHTAEDDNWGLVDFVSTPSNTGSSHPVPSAQPIWDFDEFSSPAPVASTSRNLHPIVHESAPRPNNPGDFDFENREDILLGGDSHDEDDILGMLSKPVDTIPKRMSPVSHI